MTKTMTCIICPRGCTLTVTDGQGGIRVQGEGCHRGVDYASAELRNPVRTVTTTILIESVDASHNIILQRLPVRTETAVKKDMIFDVMKACASLKVKAPVQCQQVIAQNIGGTGVDLIATRSILV